jgi:hypothetical protein
MLLFPLGVITVVLTVYERLRTGHGADAFLNGYGQYETWASYAGFLIAAPVILLGMYLLRRWQLWRRSRLQGVPPKEILEHLKRDP